MPHGDPVLKVRQPRPCPHRELFLSLLRSLIGPSLALPRLAPWAAFFRRFAALVATHGAASGELIPNIPFIVCNLVLLQERHILLLEGPLFVVLLLRGNVPRNGGYIGFTYAESAITGLHAKCLFPFSCTQREEFALTTRAISATDCTGRMRISMWT